MASDPSRRLPPPSTQEANRFPPLNSVYSAFTVQDDTRQFTFQQEYYTLIRVSIFTAERMSVDVRIHKFVSIRTLQLNLIRTKLCTFGLKFTHTISRP